jgi:hypothetical protein
MRRKRYDTVLERKWPSPSATWWAGKRYRNFATNTNCSRIYCTVGNGKTHSLLVEISAEILEGQMLSIALRCNPAIAVVW